MKYKVMALYIAPLSMYTYPKFLASCFANVLFPQEDHPSMDIMIFLVIICAKLQKIYSSIKFFAKYQYINHGFPENYESNYSFIKLIIRRIFALYSAAL